MPDVFSEQHLLRTGVGALFVERDTVLVAGPDAASFLQGQMSQDVVGLAVGTSAPSLLLQPQGKVDAWLRVTRRADEEFVLDVHGGFGQAVVDRLNRFKLRVKADLTPLDWRCLALRGPSSEGIAVEGAEVRADAGWDGVPGVDVLGSSLVVPEGLELVGPDAFEAVRIECGHPRMGRELTIDTIPEEAGIVTGSVSFTKGCYVGQELVARIDSRGANVPRRLRGFVVATNVLPPEGCEVVAPDGGGKAVGWITSVAESQVRRAPIALGYLSRTVEPPATVVLRWDGGEVEARAEVLPLVRP